MLPTEDFIERIQELLHHYDLTAAAFADKIGVQRSNISHIISGRNRPSLEFVLKVIQTFPEVDLYWLLNGQGSFPKVSKDIPTPKAMLESPEEDTLAKAETTPKTLEQIVFFFTDGSFKIYRED